MSAGRDGGASSPPLAWSWEASSRATAAANRGSRSMSSTNRSRLSWSSVVSRTACTDAERGAPVRSASSPIAAPGPRTRRVRSSPSASAITRRRPRRTTYRSSASSPSRMTQWPASARSGCASAARVSSASASAPARSGTPASVVTDTPIALIGRSDACADRTPLLRWLIGNSREPDDAPDTAPGRPVRARPVAPTTNRTRPVRPAWSGTPPDVTPITDQPSSGVPARARRSTVGRLQSRSGSAAFRAIPSSQ